MPFPLEKQRQQELESYSAPIQLHFGDSRFFFLNFEQCKVSWEKTRWRLAEAEKKPDKSCFQTGRVNKGAKDGTAQAYSFGTL